MACRRKRVWLLNGGGRFWPAVPARLLARTLSQRRQDTATVLFCQTRLLCEASNCPSLQLTFVVAVFLVSTGSYVLSVRSLHPIWVCPHRVQIT